MKLPDKIGTAYRCACGKIRILGEGYIGCEYKQPAGCIGSDSDCYCDDWVAYQTKLNRKGSINVIVAFVIVVGVVIGLAALLDWFGS